MHAGFTIGLFRVGGPPSNLGRNIQQNRLQGNIIYMSKFHYREQLHDYKEMFLEDVPFIRQQTYSIDSQLQLIVMQKFIHSYFT